MELLLPSPAAVFSIFASLLVLYVIHRLLWTSRTHKGAGTPPPPPAAPGGWPVFGHLPALGGPKLLHIALGAMADKYGPIFTINLGMRQAVVVNDRELAKECFTTNDKVFATRPKSMAVELMGYNYAMFGLSPYGHYWRQVRKITTLEFLSNRRVEMFRDVHLSEVKASIEALEEACRRAGGGGAVVEMKRWFGDLNMNIITMMLARKRYSGEEEGDDEGLRFMKAMREFFEYVGMFVPSDYLPFLRWIDWGGYEKSMRRISTEIDDILVGWLEKHKRRRREGGAAAAAGEVDFIGMMLTQLDGVTAEDFGGWDADTVIKSTCLAILSGGTETTTVSLIWVLSLLLNNRHALKKAQAELDHHVGRERRVDPSDMKNLVYLHAIIKETLRLYPAVPLLAPHEAMEGCEIGGHRVAAGTRLVLNCWKIHRDPRTWPDPEEFRPERFLGEQKEVDVRGQHFELIPFGSGRRMCPGISLTLQVMQLALAHLIHGFELGTRSDEPVDMTEAPGLTNLKATPLQVVISPRSLTV